MRPYAKFGLALLAALAVGGCTTEQVARNVYEGVRARDEARQTPMERSLKPSVSHEAYERERSGRSTRGAD